MASNDNDDDRVIAHVGHADPSDSASPMRKSPAGGLFLLARGLSLKTPYYEDNECCVLVRKGGRLVIEPKGGYSEGVCFKVELDPPKDRPIPHDPTELRHWIMTVLLNLVEIINKTEIQNPEYFSK